MFAGGVNIGPHVGPLYVKLFEKRRCPQLLQNQPNFGREGGIVSLSPCCRTHRRAGWRRMDRPIRGRPSGQWQSLRSASMSAARSAPPSRSKMASSTTANGMAVDYRRLDRNFWSPVKRRGRSWAPPQRLYSKREEYEEDQRTDDEEQQRHPRTPLLPAYQFSRPCALPME